MAAPKGNKYAKGITTNGRPPTFDSETGLSEKINEYFDSLVYEDDVLTEDEDGNLITIKVSKEVRPTVTGLALFLGFASRQSIYDYQSNEDFSYIIKRACLAIENSYEENLFSKNATGAIFALKNMGWKDKTEHDHTTKGEAMTPTIAFKKFNESDRDSG